jgi:5-hydroxyisourate hydrolase-like protein (transthyretin family)
VPNPFRAHAPWDRPPVPGDTFARHLDFLGLPRARSTIRIYTLAGDLVQTLDHDGTRGDGQARWDLISRNGQDIASGIYLFTVESGGSHQVGRFVVMR